MKNFKNFIFIGSNNLSKLFKEITETSSVKVFICKETSRKTFIIVPNISYEKQRSERELKITVTDKKELSELLNSVEIVTRGKIGEMDLGRELEIGNEEVNVNQKEVIILKSPPLCGKMLDFLTETQGLFSNESSNLCATLQRSRFYATDEQTANSMHVLPISQFSRDTLVTCGSSFLPKTTISEQEDVGLYPKIMSEGKDLINEEAVHSSSKKSNISELEKNVELDKITSEFEACLSEIFYDSLGEEVVLLECPKMTKNSKSSPAVVEIHQFSHDVKPKVRKSKVIILSEPRFKKLENSFVKFQAKRKIRTIEPLLDEYDDKNEIMDKLENKFVHQFKQMKNTVKKKNLIVINFELPGDSNDKLMADKKCTKNHTNLFYLSNISKTYVDSMKSKIDTSRKRKNRGNLVVVNDQVFNTPTKENKAQKKNISGDDKKPLVFLNNVLYKELDIETMNSILNRKFSTCENKEKKMDKTDPVGASSDEVKMNQIQPNVENRGYSEIPLDNLIAAVAEKKHEEYIVRSRIAWEVYEHYEKILENTKILNPLNQDSYEENVIESENRPSKLFKKVSLVELSETELHQKDELKSNSIFKTGEHADRMDEEMTQDKLIKNEKRIEVLPQTLRIEVENLKRLQTMSNAKSRIPVKAVTSPKMPVSIQVIDNYDRQNNSKPRQKRSKNEEKFIARKPEPEIVKAKVSRKENANDEEKTNGVPLIILKENLYCKSGSENSRLPRLINPIKHIPTMETIETFLKPTGLKSDDNKVKNDEKSLEETKKVSPTKNVEKFIDLNKLVTQTSSSKDHLLFQEKEAAVKGFHRTEYPDKFQLDFLRDMVKRPTEATNQNQKSNVDNVETVVEKIVHQIEIKEAASRPKIIRREQGTFVMTDSRSIVNKGNRKQFEKDASAPSSTEKIVGHQKEKSSGLEKRNLIEKQTDTIEAENIIGASKREVQDVREKVIEKTISPSSKGTFIADQNKSLAFGRTVNDSETGANNTKRQFTENRQTLEKLPLIKEISTTMTRTPIKTETVLKSEQQSLAEIYGKKENLEKIHPLEERKQLKILELYQKMIDGQKTISTGKTARSDIKEKSENLKGEKKNIVDVQENISAELNLEAKETVQAGKESKSITKLSEGESKIIPNLITVKTDEINYYDVKKKYENFNADQALKVEEKSEGIGKKERKITEENSLKKKTMHSVEKKSIAYNKSNFIENADKLERQKTPKVNDKNQEKEHNMKEEKIPEVKKMIEMEKKDYNVPTSEMETKTIMNIFEGNVDVTHEKNDHDKRKENEIFKGEKTRNMKEKNNSEAKIAKICAEKNSETETNFLVGKIMKIEPHTSEKDSTIITNSVKPNADIINENTNIITKTKEEKQYEEKHMSMKEEIGSLDKIQHKTEDSENCKMKFSKELDDKEYKNVVDPKTVTPGDRDVILSVISSQNIKDIDCPSEIIKNEEQNEIIRKKENNLKENTHENISSTSKFENFVEHKVEESKNDSNTLNLSAVIEVSKTNAKNYPSDIGSIEGSLMMEGKSELNNYTTENCEDSPSHPMDIFRGFTEEKNNVADKHETAELHQELKRSDNFSQYDEQEELVRVEKGIETVNNSKDASVSVKDLEDGIEDASVQSISQNDKIQSDILKYSASENVIVIKAAKKDSEETVESALGITKPFLEKIQSKVLNFVTAKSKSKVKIGNSFRSQAVRKCKEITALLKKSQEILLEDSPVGLAKLCQHAKMVKKLSRTKLPPKRLNVSTPKTTNTLSNAPADKPREFQDKKVKRKILAPEGLIKSAIENKVTSKMKSLTKTSGNHAKRLEIVKTDKTPRRPKEQITQKHSVRIDEKKEEFTPSVSISDLGKGSIGSIFAETVASALLKCGKVNEIVSKCSESQKAFTNVMDKAQDENQKIKQVEICVTDEDEAEKHYGRGENEDSNIFLIKDGEPRKLCLNVELKQNNTRFGEEYKCNVALILNEKLNSEDVEENSSSPNSATCDISQSSASFVQAEEETSKELLFSVERLDVAILSPVDDPKNYNNNNEEKEAEQVTTTKIMEKISEGEMIEANCRLPLVSKEMSQQSQEKFSKIQNEPRSSSSMIVDGMNMAQKLQVSSPDESKFHKSSSISLCDGGEDDHTNSINFGLEKNTKSNTDEREEIQSNEAVTSEDYTVFRGRNTPKFEKINSGERKGILKVDDEIRVSDDGLRRAGNRQNDQDQQVTVIKNNKEVMLTIPSPRNTTRAFDSLGVIGTKLTFEDIKKDDMEDTLPAPDNLVWTNDPHNQKKCHGLELKSSTGDHERKNEQILKADEVYSLNRQNRNSAMKYLTFSDEYTRNTLEIFPEVFLTPFSSNTDLTKELEIHNNDPEENFGVLQNLSHLSQASTGISKMIHIATSEDPKTGEKVSANSNDLRSSCRVNDYPNSKICREKDKIGAKGIRNFEYLKKRMEQDKLNIEAKRSSSKTELKPEKNLYQNESPNSKSVGKISSDWKNLKGKSDALKDAFVDLEKMGHSIKEKTNQKESISEKCSVKAPIRDYLKNPKRDFATKNHTALNPEVKSSLSIEQELKRMDEAELHGLKEETIEKTDGVENLNKPKNSFYHELVRRSEIDEIKTEGDKEREENIYKPTFHVFNAVEESFDEVSDAKKVTLHSKPNMKKYTEINEVKENAFKTFSNNVSTNQENSEIILSENIDISKSIDSETSNVKKASLNDEPSKRNQYEVTTVGFKNILPEKYEIEKKCSFEKGSKINTSKESIIKILHSSSNLEAKMASLKLSSAEALQSEASIVEDPQITSNQERILEDSTTHDVEAKLEFKPKTSQIPIRSSEVISKHKIVEKFASIHSEPGSSIYKIRRDLQFDISTKQISKRAISPSDTQNLRSNLTNQKPLKMVSQENVAKKPSKFKHEAQRFMSKKMIVKITPSKELYSPPPRRSYEELKKAFLKNPRQLLEVAGEILDKNQYLSFLLDLKSKREIRNVWWKKIYDGISSSLSLGEYNLTKIKKSEKASKIEIKSSSRVKSPVRQDTVKSRSKREFKTVKKETSKVEQTLGAFRKDKLKDKLFGTRGKMGRQSLSSTKPSTAKLVKVKINSHDKSKKSIAEMEIDKTKNKSANLKSPKGNQMLKNDNPQGNANRRNLSSQYKDSTSCKSKSLPYTLRKFLETPDLIPKTPGTKSTNSSSNFQKIFVLGEELKVPKLKNTKVYQEQPNKFKKSSNSGESGIEKSRDKEAAKNLKNTAACQECSKPLIETEAEINENHSQKYRVTRMLEEDLFQETQLTVGEEGKPLSRREKGNGNPTLEQTYNSNGESNCKELVTLRSVINEEELAANKELAEIGDVCMTSELKGDTYVATSENLNENDTESATEENRDVEVNTQQNCEKALLELPISNENTKEIEALPNIPDRAEIKDFPRSTPESIAGSIRDISDFCDSPEVLSKDSVSNYSEYRGVEQRDDALKEISQPENSIDILCNHSVPILSACRGVEERKKEATDFDNVSDVFSNRSAPISSVWNEVEKSANEAKGATDSDKSFDVLSNRSAPISSACSGVRNPENKVRGTIDSCKSFDVLSNPNAQISSLCRGVRKPKSKVKGTTDSHKSFDIISNRSAPISSMRSVVRKSEIEVKGSTISNKSFDNLFNKNAPVASVCSGVKGPKKKVKEGPDVNNSSNVLSKHSSPISSDCSEVKERKNIVKKTTASRSGKGEILKRNALFEDSRNSNEKLMIGTKQMGHMNFQTRRKFENPLNKFVSKNKLTSSGTTDMELSQESIADSSVNADTNLMDIRVIRTKSFSEVLKDDPNLLIRQRERKKMPPYVTPRRVEEAPVRRFEYKYHDFRRKFDVGAKASSKLQQTRKKDFFEKFRDLMQTKKIISGDNRQSTEDGPEQMKPKVLSTILDKMKHFQDEGALDPKKADNKGGLAKDTSTNPRRNFCNSLYLKSKFGSWRFVHTKMEQIDEDELMTWVQEHPGTPISKNRSDNPKGDVNESQNVIHVPWISARNNNEEEN